MSRREHITGALIVGLVLAIGWRLGIIGGEAEGQNVSVPRPTVSTDSDGATSTTERELERRDYAPGDCVIWEVGRSWSETDVVGCTEPHRIEITEKVSAPEGLDYPSEQVWDEFQDTQCGSAAERFLGVPMDPYGRFAPTSITPTARGWKEGDREVWCGIGTNVPQTSDAAVFSQEVRGADQGWHFEPGHCVAEQPVVDYTTVVPCNEAHQMEIVGAIDISDWAAPPTDIELQPLFDECLAQVEVYVGGQLAPPWQYFLEGIAPESWAAGTRTIHCYLGQSDANNEPIVVNTPVRG